MNLAPSSDLRDPSKAVILEGKVENTDFLLLEQRQNKGKVEKYHFLLLEQRHGCKTKNIWFNRE